MIAHVLESLGYGEQPFGIIGFSGGTPYALACTQVLPGRVFHLVIVSGHALPNISGVKLGEEDHLIEIFRRRNRLAHFAVKMTIRRLHRNPDKVVARVTKRWNTADRNLIMCNAAMKWRLEVSLAKTTQCGPDGIV